MSGLAAALKIVWQSFAYRVRMREANNLAVTVSMMVAFALPWRDVLYRTGYALLLNVYVYLINDYCDIRVDLASEKKDHAKVRYMADHRGAALGALLGLGALLAAGALFHSWLLVGAFVANTVVITLYSAWLKRVPIVDLLLMAIAGGTMTIVGLPERQLGWLLLGLLSLLCASYEVIQVIRDEPVDRQSGVHTTAVLVGVRPAAWIYRGLMVGSAAYGFLVVGSLVPLALALGALLPLSPERAPRTWDMARIVSGSVWLALMAQVYLGYL